MSALISKVIVIGVSSRAPDNPLPFFSTSESGSKLPADDWKASGNLGRPVVSALLAKKLFEVSALIRSTSCASFPDSVTLIRTDYTHASLVSAFQGQDAVVCTMATSSLTEQKRVIDSAVEAGVKRFFPSEFGFDTSEDVVMKVAPCTDMKRDTVAYLKEKEKFGMSWTSVVTGLWVDWTREFTRFDDGEAAFEASTLDQVARVVASILAPENLAATRNTYVSIHSYTLSQNRLPEILESAPGGAEWSVTPNRVKDICAMGQEKFFRLSKDKSLDELGDVPEFQMAIVLMVSSGAFGLGGVNQFAAKAKYWMGKLGLEDEDPDIVMKRAVAQVEGRA